MDSKIKTTVNERIGLMVNHFTGGNKSAFAKLAIINNQSLAEILGGRQSAPSFETLQKLINTFPDVSVEWIMTGRGSMLRNEVEQPSPPQTLTPTSEQVQEIAKRVIEAHMANEQMQEGIKRILAKAQAEAKADQDALIKVYAVGEGYGYPFGPDSKLSLRLGITEEEALRLVVTGKIRAVDVGDEGYRISERAVREYLGEVPTV